MKNILDHKTFNLEDILGNGKKYKIPDFQRDYSWKEENWEDLWADMINLLQNKNEVHYMGSIVLQNIIENDDKFIVVDGQQRLTTMSIFVLSVLAFLQNLVEKNIETEKNKFRIDIFKKFIGIKPATTLFYVTKLELNENNDTFYRQYLTEHKTPKNFNKLRDSEKLLLNSFDFFLGRLNSFFENDSGDGISAFLENVVAKKMYFLQITVDDELSAYTVFETLNARGVELTTTDLLKNYLFSLVKNSNSDLKVLKENWQNIVDSISFKDFPNFLRYFMNSKHQLIRQSNLFREIKNRVKTPNEVIDLLDELKEIAELYVAIKNPEDEFWLDNKNKTSIQKSLEELNLFGVKQPIPVLFAVYKNLPNLFADVLKALTVISFRYNVIGKLNPNELETSYNKLSQKISNKEIVTKKQIFAEIRGIYVLDKDFENNFATKSVSTKGSNSKKIVRYILTKLENQIANQEYDFEDIKLTIEHILPENYTEEWQSIFGQDIDSYIYRIGNYTILNNKDNKNIGNGTFEKKLVVYKKSNFRLSSDKIEYEVWSPKNLNQRQKYLSKVAKSVWKIEF